MRKHLNIAVFFILFVFLCIVPAMAVDNGTSFSATPSSSSKFTLVMDRNTELSSDALQNFVINLYSVDLIDWRLGADYYAQTHVHGADIVSFRGKYVVRVYTDKGFGYVGYPVGSEFWLYYSDSYDSDYLSSIYLKLQFWGSTINGNVCDIVNGVTALTDKFQFWGSTINDNVNALNDTRSILNTTNAKIENWASIINDSVCSLNDTRSIVATTNEKLVGVQDGVSTLVDKLNFWSSTINDNVVSLNDTRSIIAATNEKLDGILKALPSSGGSSESVDLTGVITSIDNVSASVTALNTDLSVNLDSLVDKLQIVVDNSQTNIDNVTNVVIDQTNNAYHVFYLTGEDGTEHSIGEATGGMLSASGKLLNFLYRLCVEGALSKVDDSIDSMSGFYFDSSTGTEGSIWD